MGVAIAVFLNRNYHTHKNMNIENKDFRGAVEVKETREDGRLNVTLYGCAFGNVDSYGDIIVSSACDRFLKSEDAARTVFCNQHDIHSVVGVINEMHADEYGLKMDVDILPTTAGKDLQILLRAGAIKEFSIGYYANDCDYDADGHRILKDITIIEVSAVSRAANPKAVVTSMKNDAPVDDTKADEGVKEGQEGGNNLDLEGMADDDLNALAERVECEQYRRVFMNL